MRGPWARCFTASRSSLLAPLRRTRRSPLYLTAWLRSSYGADIHLHYVGDFLLAVGRLRAGGLTLHFSQQPFQFPARRSCIAAAGRFLAFSTSPHYACQPSVGRLLVLDDFRRRRLRPVSARLRRFARQTPAGMRALGRDGISRFSLRLPARRIGVASH